MRLTYAIAISCYLLTGCAQRPNPVQWPEERLLGKGIPAFKAPIEPVEVKQNEPILNHDGDLTLQAAFTASLLHNPELKIFAWEIRVKEAQALQASMLVNPEIEVEIEDFAGSGSASGFDNSETTILFSQLIELGQKRQKRVRVGELNQDLAAWDYEAARLQVLTSVASTFIETLALQQQVEFGDSHSRAIPPIIYRNDTSTAPAGGETLE